VIATVSRRAAVFLDRDGTLIEDPGFLADPSGVAFLDGALDALRRLREGGFALVVVSNQSGIARGLIAADDAEAVHRRFVHALADEGLALDDVRYCPHGPDDACTCRKPLPGLIVGAADALGLDLDRSFMVGDKADDVEAGRRAGCHTIQLGSANGNADHAARDWKDVVEYIERTMVAST
jgi:D-glycero-D-manno-heptose 1,7-bisphosphate phosphatase